MHDDKQMFLDFLKIKEMQKAKEWFYDPQTLQAHQIALKQITKVKEL